MSDIFSVNDGAKKRDELDQFIAQVGDGQGSLIAILHKAQHLFGYLPKEIQLYVARKLDIPAAKVNGVVSFYSYFSQEKRGEHTISVCMGTACFVKGAEPVMTAFSEQLGIQNKETTADEMFTLRDVRCIGACGLAPVVMIDEKVYGHVGKDDVKGIIEEYK